LQKKQKKVLKNKEAALFLEFMSSRFLGNSSNNNNKTIE
jgi:hypothetical protein